MSNTKRSRKKSRSVRIGHQKKNVRSQRGIPETNYGEIKKISSFSLTPTALNLLKNLSQELNISTSELLERFARLGTKLKADLGRSLVLDELLSEWLEDLNKP
jgi:hypothetical protein